MILGMVVAAWLYRNARDGRLGFVRIWATALLFTATAAGVFVRAFPPPRGDPVGRARHRAGFASPRSPGTTHPSAPRLFTGALFAVIGVSGWSPSSWRVPNRDLSVGYYANVFAGRLIGAVSQIHYDAYFDGPSYGEHEAEQWISSHNLIGVTAMLWTNLAWPFVDDGLLPSTRSAVRCTVTLALEGKRRDPVADERGTAELILITPPASRTSVISGQFIGAHDYVQVMDADGNRASTSVQALSGLWRSVPARRRRPR